MMYKLLSCAALAMIPAANAKSIVETAGDTASLSTLATVLKMDGYKGVLDALNGDGPFTVFAPSNDAFAAAGVNTSLVETVTQVLFYHVLGSKVMSTDLAALQFPESLMKDEKFVNVGGKGQVYGITKDDTGVTINFGIPGEESMTAKVITADVECDNGVVHIIDKVLMFPKKVSETATAAGLTELVKALTKAELVSAVDDTPGVTIFAPTDTAMKAAKWETLDMDTLKAVLKYHVVPAVAYSTDLTDGQKVATLNGKEITLKVTDSVMANDAKVATANALVTNGVVHVIDKVLIPSTDPEPTAPTPAPTDESAATTFGPAVGLSMAAGVFVFGFGF